MKYGIAAFVENNPWLKHLNDNGMLTRGVLLEFEQEETYAIECVDGRVFVFLFLYGELTECQTERVTFDQYLKRIPAVDHADFRKLRW